MAWRPSKQVIEGILDNTVQGKVTGWIKFAGRDRKIIFDLEGDFNVDIRGKKVRLRGEGKPPDSKDVIKFMKKTLFTVQKGKVGDMTAGGDPDYVDYGYFEWFAGNDRVVIELDSEQVEVL